MKKAFELFRKDAPVTSMEGVSVSFTEAQLQGIAQRYDPKLHEAPIVVGHPEHDAPAYGWVESLGYDGGTLAASEHQVDPAFAELRDAGRFKKVSARFYTPTSKNNPTPGEYYLRDVGFLGAMPPAVKGLRNFSFGDGDDQVVTAEVSFADMPAWSGESIASLFRGLREWIVSKFGIEEADKHLPDYRIQGLQDTAVAAQAREQPKQPSLAFREPSPISNDASKEHHLPAEKTKEQLQAELDTANTALASERTARTALEEADRKRATSALHDGNVSFADKLIAGARWPAAAKDVLVATLDHLSGPGDVVSFGEGDSKKPLIDELRAQLEALPEQVSFAEHATRRKGAAGAGGLTDRQVAARATAYQERQALKGINLTTGQAIDAVNAGTDQE